jgi:hypothetical protein
MSELNTFINAYFEAIYFTELGDMEQPPNHAELEASSQAEQVHDAKEFYEKYNYLFNDHVQQAGHDFWFTRQGHGVGFWDRDRAELYGQDEADKLVEACEEFGPVHELVWEVDGEIFEGDL